ncbi:hypothetical protein CSKR_111467, partial [Clonorchis sinensis]
MSITLDRLDECSETWMGIFAINFAGDSPVSPLVKLISPSAPTAPNDVRFNVDRRTRKIHITWKDTSVCPTTNYTLSDVQKGWLVTTVNREAYLDFGVPCYHYQIHIKGANTGGQGPASDVIRFFTPHNFDAPTNVRVTTEPSVPDVEVSWLATGVCHSIQYMVTLYVAGVIVKTEVTESLNVILRDLEKCKPSSITVKKYTQWWSGDESGRTEFQIPGVPSAPKLIGATTEQNVPSATVSWTYDGACTSTDFLVTVYATAESVPEPVRASGLSTSIGGLPMCVDLVFGVVGRNQFGSGQETKSSPIRIDAVPSAPKLIEATTEQNVSSATVSWTYDGACTSTDFLVTVYTTAGSVPEPVRASGLSTSIGGLPMCVDLVFGVVGRNQFGSGQETKSSPIRIDAVPSAPKLIGATTEQNVPSATVSWTYDGACTSTDFLVTVYTTAGSVPEPVRASGLSTSIGGLP